MTTDANTAATDNVETTTNKYTKRGNSKFKSRKDGAEKDVPQIEKPREEETDIEIRTRRPYFSSTAARNDRPTPRNFARRRLGGANSTTKSYSSTTVASITRRPFRIASRRRPAATTKTTSTTTTTTTQSTTNILDSEESLQEIEDTDSLEDPTLTSGSSPRKNPKVQRRPLVSLKEEQDQNPSATNEEEKKRQSKKYSSNFKKNQLDEILKLKVQDSYDVEVDASTEGKFTIENYSADTAVALAAHKLLEAPVPIIPDYENDAKPTTSTLSRNTQRFKYTNPDYAQEISKTSSYPEAYSTTPSYNTPTQNYIQTSTGSVISSDLLDTVLPTSGSFRGNKPAGFTAPTIINPGLSGVSRNLGPSTVRYLSTNDPNTATQNINDFDSRYTVTSERYSKAPPSTVQYLSTVDNYSGVSYDLTPTDRYSGTSEPAQTLNPTDNTRHRRPTTTTGGYFDIYENNKYDTSQTRSPNDIFIATSRKYSEVPRVTDPPTNRYVDTNTGYTGLSQDLTTTKKYADASDRYPDAFRTAGPSTIDYLDSNTRYIGTSQNLNPTERFTITSERYTELARNTNPSTTYFTEDNKYTRTPLDQTPNTYTELTEKYTEASPNTRVSTNKYTDASEGHSTIQNSSPTYTYTDTSDKYTSISRRRKPSTSTESDKYTTGALQSTNPTIEYTVTSDRYTQNSRRRKPSTSTYTEKYTTSTLPSITSTQPIISTTEKSLQSRRRIPSTYSYTTSEQTTESIPASVFEKYTNTPRRARPSTLRYRDTVTETDITNPSTIYTGLNTQFTEIPSRIRPSTDRYTDASESTETPTNPIETYTTSKKYSEVSRNRNPSNTYPETTEKQVELTEVVSTGRYTNPNGQYTGFIRDLNPSTIKYLRTEGKSPSESPTSAKYPSTTEKYVSGPIDDYQYSTAGYSQSHEPSYFTREYLLASPVTKTYDDEYQYLSPVTTEPTTTTKKPPRRKTVFRRISSTAAPISSTSTTTLKPRRSSRKPFEKIRKVQKVKIQKVQKKKPVEVDEQLLGEEQPLRRVQPQRVPVKKVVASNAIRPVSNYDYYDDGEEKVAQKYEEGTKVILHAKGTIECLDIGNFPHPSSCKKFISCARLENGSLLGWEYVCPKGLSFDPVGGICNWSAGLGCNEDS